MDNHPNYVQSSFSKDRAVVRIFYDMDPAVPYHSFKLLVVDTPPESYKQLPDIDFSNYEEVLKYYNIGIE